MIPWKHGGIAVAFLLAVSLSFPSYATKQDIDAAKQKASSMEEEKKKVEQTLNSLQGLKSDTTAYVKQLDQSLNSLNDELEKLTGEITAKEGEITATQAQLEEAKIVEAKQYASMKLRIKYMYEKGDTSYIDMLMKAKDFSEMLNRAEYIRKISEYDRNMLNEYAATKQTIADAEVKLEGEHQELLTLQDSTKAKQSSVEQLMTAKQAELSNYETRIASAEGQIDAYQQDIAAQESKIKQIEAEIRKKEEEAKKREEEAKKREEEARKKAEETKKSAGPAEKSYTTASKGNTKFTWPCPSSGSITSGFGGRSAPTEGASSNHQGIDIGASSGSSIVAAASGTVTIATYSPSAGNYIMISHGDGLSTVYMHCSSINVSVGQTVSQGQKIGSVGSTGYSTGPHLHFGVRSGGSYVNPTKYVSP